MALVAFAFCLGLIVLGIVLAIRGGGHPDYDRTENPGLLVVGWLSIVVGVLLTITLTVVWPTSYYASLSTVQELEAFRESQPAYLQSIERARSVEIAAAEAGALDAAYFEQSRSYTELVRDYRDKIVWYNEALQKTRAYREVPVFGWFRVGVDLEPILDPFEGVQ